MTQRIHVASPCPANWEKMAGDDRVRFCPECNLNVYNFSAMTAAEVERIVSRREGRLCARLYQRADGTMLTKNCPVGFRAVMWRATRVASATLAALLSLRPAMGQSTGSTKEPLTQITNARRGLSLRVLDPSGAALAHAKITAVNETTGKEVQATTDSAGMIELGELAAGFYDITAQAQWFKAVTKKHVAVPGQETMELPLGHMENLGVVVVVSNKTVIDPDIDIHQTLTPPAMSAPHNNRFSRFLARIRRAI